MGDEIVIEGETFSLSEFQELSSFDEKFELLTYLIIGVQKQIASLALVIKANMDREQGWEEETKSILKSIGEVSKTVKYKLNELRLVHDILYDRVGFAELNDYLKSDKYRKEKNPLKMGFIV